MQKGKCCVVSCVEVLSDLAPRRKFLYGSNMFTLVKRINYALFAKIYKHPRNSLQVCVEIYSYGEDEGI